MSRFDRWVEIAVRVAFISAALAVCVWGWATAIKAVLELFS